MNLNYHFVFGILAGIFSIVAGVPYIFSILKKGAKPNRATWIIWNVTNLIMLCSYFAIGARTTIFAPLFYVIFAFTILILSYKYGVSSWSRLDTISLLVAGLSLVVWFLTKNPLLALLMDLVMDVAGYLPTLKKSYIDPMSESRIAWLLIFLGAMFNVFAINTFSFGIIIYPAMMFLADGVLLAVLYRKEILKFF